MTSTSPDEIRQRAISLVIVCAVVNILGSVVIMLVLVEHMRIVHPVGLDVDVKVKRHTGNESKSYEFAPNQMSLAQPTPAPDAAMNETQPEDQSAFEPLVILKVLTEEPLSPSSDSSRSQNSVDLLDSSDSVDSSAVTTSFVNSTQPHNTTHSTTSKQRKKPAKPTMHDTLKIPERSAKHRKSTKHKASKNSKVLPATRYHHESRSRE